MDVDDFYLYLPSSTQSTVQTNTISHYTVTLSAPIRLPPDVEYECAMAKIIYPTSMGNVYDGNFQFYSANGRDLLHVRILEGYYRTSKEIFEAMKKSLGKDQSVYHLGMESRNKSFYLQRRKAPWPVDDPEEPYLNLSDNLASLTGLPKIMTGFGTSVSSHPVDMSGGMQNVYLYCDLMQNSHIGDTMGPLLCIFSYHKSAVRRQLEYEPKNLVYFPITKEIISEVTVEARGRTGVYAPFESGELMVLIHVRPKRSR